MVARPKDFTYQMKESVCVFSCRSLCTEFLYFDISRTVSKYLHAREERKKLQLRSKKRNHTNEGKTLNKSNRP